MHVNNFRVALRNAIAEARAAGLVDSANQLETRALAAYPTSSEWLGEVGEAIQEFLACERERVPATTARLLDECLSEVGKVWPKYRP